MHFAPSLETPDTSMDTEDSEALMRLFMDQVGEPQNAPILSSIKLSLSILYVLHHAESKQKPKTGTMAVRLSHYCTPFCPLPSFPSRVSTLTL
jgi:hypothetical protein